jgi:hypothetical protein
MVNPWGVSWGVSWGDSWGVEEQPEVQTTDFHGRARVKRKQRRELEERKRQEELRRQEARREAERQPKPRAAPPVAETETAATPLLARQQAQAVRIAELLTEITARIEAAEVQAELDDEDALIALLCA